MRIPLTGLPQAGRVINAHLPKEALNARLNESEDSGFVFHKDISLKGTLVPRAAGAEFKGSYQAWYQQPCARCSEDMERTATGALRLIFRSPEDHEDDSMDDQGLIFLEDNVIDLTDAVHEEIILALDIFWTCDKTPDDITIICKNTETSTSTLPEEKSSAFGSLLQEALQGKKEKE